MNSMKKIVSIITVLLFILSYTTLKTMNKEAIEKKIKDRRKENRKIRRELRAIQAKTIQVVHETEKLKNLAKCKRDGITLSSHDGKNQLVTIYFKDGSQCYRSNKDFIELWQEKSSDEESDGTFEHSNREDGPIENIKNDKKCCRCVLI